MVQLLYIVASVHVLLCPFTKVEESFNIQSVHDILYHRHNLSQYDHNEFPGVVPRTFIGPLVIAAVSAPIVNFLYLLGINKFWTQYVVRLSLTLAVIVTWSRLRSALQKQFGSTFAWWYSIITVTQYHFMFYMSRPLPNIMVLPLVLLAFEGWILGKHKQFIISAGAAIIIFRAELAMLFGLFLIIDLYFKKIDVQTLLKITIPAGITLVTLTVVVDSIFWGRLLWPEAEVFWYNTFMNKSSDWGTAPFLWYIYSALPRGLGPSLLLVPVGVYLERRLVPMIAPAVVYVLLYSILPHKELRFIIYVFPLLNMGSAAACSYVFIRRNKAPIFELLFVGVIVVVVANVIMTAAFTMVAMTNYPGGVAITRFHKLLKNEPYVNVHISNLAAQTGVTRFTQLHDHWRYNKTENLRPRDLMTFTHLIIEAKSKYSPSIKAFSRTHDVLDNVESFSQIAGTFNIFPPIRIKTKPALFILERKAFRDNLEGPVDEDIDLNDVISAGNIDSASEETFDFERAEQGVYDEQARIADKVSNVVEDEIPIIVTETIVDDEEDEVEQDNTKMLKAKKAVDELKSLRQEWKKKAIAKIKSETRKEVVASAKEKLKEIMKRHKHIADEMSENIISDVKNEEKGERGDVPEEEDYVIPEQVDATGDEETEQQSEETELPDEEKNEGMSDNVDAINRTNENIDTIVEEVIARLIDRRIYDDKTKPEDIKAEDRQMIQKIVEEVLSERMNYSDSETK